MYDIKIAIFAYVVSPLLLSSCAEMSQVWEDMHVTVPVATAQENAQRQATWQHGMSPL